MERVTIHFEILDLDAVDAFCRRMMQEQSIEMKPSTAIRHLMRRGLQSYEGKPLEEPRDAK